jgi:hypothetical protein
VISLEARGRLIAHSAEPGLGVETATADPSRTLVGMARIIAGPAWAETATKVFVLSWFNRRARRGVSSFTANRSTASATFVEIDAEIRVEALNWAGDTVRQSLIGTVRNDDATGGANSGATIDTTAVIVERQASQNTGTASVSIPMAFGIAHTPAEGYHFYTLLGARVAAGTALWVGAAAAGLRTAHYVEVSG